jgi:Zn-dependent peptidase ImmA (M78 family)/transcriptional regulator with XRE-family HTH domain
MNEPACLGIKLRQARLATGQSTRRVAERLGPRVKVSHATLANYEAGRSQPTLDVLTALATIYERPLNWFLSNSLTFTNVRYRNRKSRVRQGDLVRYESHALKWLQAYRLLESTLTKPLQADLLGFRIEPNESGAAAAARLRKKLGLNVRDKVTSVADLLERLGVRAIELPTELAIDGLAATAGGEYVVVLNSTVSSDRARLNAAHEVGHVLAGDCDSNDVDNSGPSEDRAFDFASHLLLTQEMLEHAFSERSMVRLVQFKERFGISVAAMIYRAQESGLLSEVLAKRIWIEINRRGWKQSEPGHVAEDRAVRFERLLDAALLEERLTLEQAAELTGVRADELRERREWALGLVAWRSSPYVKSPNKETPPLRLVY